MEDVKTRTVVLGAGSIGCFVGLSWLSTGLDVSFIGRSAMGDAISKGAKITAEGTTRRIEAGHIHFFETPNILAGADIVALATKMTGDEEAASAINRHARPGTLVLSLQNGVENGARLAAMMPAMRIAEAMVPYNVARPEPNHFRKASSGDTMMARGPLLERCLAPLSGGPFAVEFRDDMREVKWSKLLLNLNNPLNALSGQTLYDQISQRGWRHILARAQRECLAVMKANTIEPAKLGPLPPRLIPPFLGTPDWFFNRTGLRLQRIERDSRTSMAEDFLAGRRTEIDFINGAVVAHAGRSGLAAPVNAAIVDLVHRAENGGRGTWTSEEVRAEISRRKEAAAS
jgi:2-dehydropantoate 2-reductase